MQPEKDYNKMLWLPMRRKLGGVNFYEVSFPFGYRIFVKVDSRPQPEQIAQYTIVPGSQVPIMKHDFFELSEYYYKTKGMAKRIRNSW